MRADPSHYSLVAPATLNEALALLAQEPGRYTPIAGGTELMVAFNTGRLAQKSLLSLQHCNELRVIEAEEGTISIGAATTFTDLRRSEQIARDLPLLAQAASWTGSIANQNRATLGGNLVNGSPAADSPPALLAYGAHLTLVSSQGLRTLPYAEFHLGYKQTALRPDELLHSIQVQQDWTGYTSYIRKVGTRNAQAISKVALACLARVEPAPVNAGGSSVRGVVADIRIAAASLADRPLRCTDAEAALDGRPLTRDTIAQSCRAIASEARPINDIRSTGKYRAAVAANLLEEFLLSLAQ